MAILVGIYRAWPFRPHCGAGRHTLLCRLIVPHIPSVTCKGDNPTWKDWQR